LTPERDGQDRASREPAKIVIIGDRFMAPPVFEAAIRGRCAGPLAIEAVELPWPDEPMLHGYADPGMEGLKEYQGDPDDIIRWVREAEIVVTQLAPFSATMLERLPKLRLIVVARGGPVNIDLAAARRQNVLVVNTPGRNASAVAEFTIGVILAETRLIARGHDGLRRGVWRGDLYRADLVGPELSQLSVGVVGYGHIGTRVVRLLKAFGGRVLVADPYVQLSAEDARDGVRHVTLEALLGESDVVTLHARLTEETLGFIGQAEFTAMRKGAYFVNTARGPLVDYTALTEALKSGRLRGAVVETFAVEPTPPDLELLRLENVTLTPHIAGASLKTIHRAADAAAEEVRRYVSGEAALNPCQISN
jgi:D-3-phosphoglycerate dehydrogenase